MPTFVKTSITHGCGTLESVAETWTHVCVAALVGLAPGNLYFTFLLLQAPNRDDSLAETPGYKHTCMGHVRLPKGGVEGNLMSPVTWA